MKYLILIPALFLLSCSANVVKVERSEVKYDNQGNVVYEHYVRHTQRLKEASAPFWPSPELLDIKGDSIK